MTTQRDLKTIVRARMAKTGESYATAYRHIRAAKVADSATPTIQASETAHGERWHPAIGTTRAEAEALLEKALALEPRLTINGLAVYGESNKRLEAAKHGQSVQDPDNNFVRAREELHEHLHGIAASADWIKRQIRIKTFNTDGTSYGYKHIVERWFRDKGGPHVQVPNGSFIAAALGLGYSLKPSGPNSPNAYFQFSRRGIRLLTGSEG